jgi:hypothetical protein
MLAVKTAREGLDQARRALLLEGGVTLGVADRGEPN